MKTNHKTKLSKIMGLYGVSNSNLAKKLKMSQANVSQVRSGNHKFSPEIAAEVRKLFNNEISLHDLLVDPKL